MHQNDSCTDEQQHNDVMIDFDGSNVPTDVNVTELSQV